MEKASSNLIKNLKKQIRENRHLLFLDNPKIIKDAIASKKVKPIIALVSEEDLGKNFPCETYLAPMSVISSLVDVKTPQGVCVLTEYIPHIVEKPKTNFLVLDNIQDPGNAGTLIRSALATGFESVFLLDGVRVVNSKLVRSTVGALFSLNVYEMKKDEFIEKARLWNLNLLNADMNGENLFDTKIEEQVGVVIGNEGQGISKELEQLCSKSIRIPMNSGIESLNAGVSGSIIMYHLNKNKIK